MGIEIYFIEEYPTIQNLKKQQLIDFDYGLVIAAASLDQFKERRDLAVKAANGNLKNVCYWLVLDEVEEGKRPYSLKNGYWVSSFINLNSLMRAHKEVKAAEKENIDIMIDLEYPLLNKGWFLKLFDIPGCIKNRLILDDIISHPNVLTFESANYPDWIMKRLGMAYDPKKYENKGNIKMLYKFNQPLARLNNSEIREYVIRYGVENHEDKFGVALGCIAKGVFNDEKLIASSELQEHIKIAAKLGVKRIYIFRLGGLNNEYVDAIKDAIKYHYLKPVELSRKAALDLR